MKISWLLDWEVNAGQLSGAEDGHWEMVRLLGKEHEVRSFICAKDQGIFPYRNFPIYMVPQEQMAQTIYDWEPEVIIVWGDLTRPTLHQLAGGRIPVFVSFAGGDTDNVVAHKVQGIFVESKSYLDRFKARGLNAMVAFGVNDRVFRPIKQPKVWDAIFPATFADWKRHKLFAESVSNGFCFGYMYYDHEQYCWQYPQERGIMIAPHLSSEAVAYVMNASHSCLITSSKVGGSQRTVLEAMACNIPPIVMSDSDKTSEYVYEAGFGMVVEPEIDAIKEAVEKCKHMDSNNGGREYIEKNWTAEKFKNDIVSGIIQSL